MTQSERFELGPFPLVAYGWMFGATVIGQFLGIALTVAARVQAIWLPALVSVGLEAWMAVRHGAPVDSHALTRADCGRLSAYYSTGLGMLTIPLFVWTAAAKSPDAPPFGGMNANLVVLLAVAVFAALAVLRWGVMVLLLPRGRA